MTKEIVDGENGRKKLIAEINEYLKYSYNVNQIGVSGNIISSDGNLIYSVRDDKAIDSDKIYPSVNGNVEIADKNVSLYIDSVDVDYPSLDINGYQNSFGAELCRESAAELNIPLNNNLLKCYGIIISGNIPSCTVKDEDLNKIDDSTLYPFKISLPFKSSSSIKKAQPTTSPPNDSINLIAA